MGDRDNPISVRSKRRITEALLKLLQTTPFSKISIKDIVEEAGLTRQTFYHNFDTKEEVLLCRLEELIEGFLQYLADKKVTEWEDIVCFFFRYWQEHADFMRLLQKNGQLYLLAEQMPRYFDVVYDIHFSKTDLSVAEARFWFAYVSGALVNVLGYWLDNSFGVSARELSKMVVSMMHGTMAERNRYDAGTANLIVEYLTHQSSDRTDENPTSE